MISSAAVGPSIWVVSDGRAGIERQAVAIAQALGELHRWANISHIRSTAHKSEPVRISPKAPQLWLPPQLWLAPLAALPKPQRDQLKAPWPDIWIGSGRRSVPYSMRVKKWSNGKTLVVQTQDPKVNPSHFDLVIPPEHDQLEGSNVLSTIGAPAHFSMGDLEQAALNFGDLIAEPGRKAAVIIGGTSKTHTLSETRAKELEQELRGLAAQGIRMWITVSRRTPEHARIRFRNMAEEVGARFWESETTDGPNPYLAFLSMSDLIFVTEDSANMISEAAWFGKPVYLLKLVGKSAKFDRLHQSFTKQGIARWYEGKVEHWPTEPVREIDRAADEIIKRLLEKHPKPK
ncbi:mitochondrial fission ELM1 family protein [Hirschia baltica]|uniref:Nucleoside-diphosphate sugar epimerase n=1 Tax=Hirschia baltica (strain ATCC 49814 / DSM 5838 / IFAM 1418) TaxID=582402 RepID=C6XRG7_HIRBI|nr:mitochondrial fission ELM1 family protein [Hirschia baltica]ACT58799.1 protein of unknown function DUF1022 [Hirschia baltica ATCC 49814]